MRPATLALELPLPASDLSVWRVRMECPNGGPPIAYRIAALSRSMAVRKMMVSLDQAGRAAGRLLCVECLGPAQASNWPDAVR